MLGILYNIALFVLMVGAPLPLVSPAAAFAGNSGAADNHSAGVVGRWKTIDDATQKPKSIVEIEARNGVIFGHIIKVIDPPKPNPVCKECSGEKKNKPIIGLEIMWDFRKKGDDEWGGGHILDPNNGKTYNCRLRLKDAGQKLEVRGYIGLSLFGRSQTWLREPNS